MSCAVLKRALCLNYLTLRASSSKELRQASREVVANRTNRTNSWNQQLLGDCKISTKDRYGGGGDKQQRLQYG
eukprot:9045749-Alexandrium_andersonii.AAC.1